MASPVARTLRSPKRFVHDPAKGDDTKRMRANADTTAEAASAETPKESAKMGMEGMTIPNPSATKKAMEARTLTSTGRSRSSGIHRRTIDDPTPPSYALRRRPLRART